MGASIVAEEERASLARTPPQGLLTKRELVVVKGVRSVSFEHASAGESGGVVPQRQPG